MPLHPLVLPRVIAGVPVADLRGLPGVDGVELSHGLLTRCAVIRPVYPFLAAIAHCTTRLAAELATRHDVTLISFKRPHPRSLYPGESDLDPTLNDRTHGNAEFILDIL